MNENVNRLLFRWPEKKFTVRPLHRQNMLLEEIRRLTTNGRGKAIFLKNFIGHTKNKLAVWTMAHRRKC
jgi:hypothetical protein